MMSFLNGELCKTFSSDRFLTALYGSFVQSDGELKFKFSRAGHTVPILWRKGFSVARTLQSDDTALGRFPEAEYKTASITLKSGDYLLFYTDGLIEQSDGEGNLLGEEGLVEMIDPICITIPDSKGLIDGVCNRLQSYTGSEDFTDDVMLLCCRIL